MDINVSIKAFNIKIDNLINGKFLFFARGIPELLRLVAIDSNIFNAASMAMKGCDLQEEREKAIIPTSGGEVFKLPLSKKRIIALVLDLLHSFDSDNTRIVEFMERFYPAADLNTSYQKMCAGILVPLNEAMTAILAGGMPEDVSEENIDVPCETAIPDGAIHAVEDIIRNINTVLVDAVDLDAKSKNDYIILTDGLFYAMTQKEARTVKIVFTGLKYALKSYKPISRLVQEIEAALKLYLLI